ERPPGTAWRPGTGPRPRAAWRADPPRPPAPRGQAAQRGDQWTEAVVAPGTRPRRLSGTVANVTMAMRVEDAEGEFSLRSRRGWRQGPLRADGGHPSRGRWTRWSPVSGSAHRERRGSAGGRGEVISVWRALRGAPRCGVHEQHPPPLRRDGHPAPPRVLPSGSALATQIPAAVPSSGRWDRSFG